LTIIFQNGGIFWIEKIIVVIPFAAIDTVTSSPITNLTRPGRVVAHSAITAGGIAQASVVTVLDQASSTILDDEFITGVLGRGITRIAPASDVTVWITLFMRK